MNRDLMIKETIRLAHSVNRGLSVIGCVHRVKGKTHPETISVPLERARYDLENGLSWIEIDPKRLPRGFTFDRLCVDGLQRRVAESFQQPVVLAYFEESIVVACLHRKTEGFSSLPTAT